MAQAECEIQSVKLDRFALTRAITAMWDSAVNNAGIERSLKRKRIATDHEEVKLEDVDDGDSLVAVDEEDDHVEGSISSMGSRRSSMDIAEAGRNPA